MGAVPEPVPPEFDRPEKIDRYEIVEEIGRGSMGVVYLARDPLIGRWLAVKELVPQKGSGLDPAVMRKLLLNEARLTGTLEHPGIVRVFDVVGDRQGGLLALAMEFVQGKSLRRRLSEPEPISLEEVSRIVGAVATALDHAHEQGLVHRDVKPANILLASDGGVKVTDFGIGALRDEDLASELMSLGTPNYLAPERILGQPSDHRLDVYALGVVLYELLTRHLPFEADAVSELMGKILREEPTPPETHAPHLTASLRRLLAKALAKAPEERFQSAGELAHDLRLAVEAQAAMNDTVPTESWLAAARVLATPVELEVLEASDGEPAGTGPGPSAADAAAIGTATPTGSGTAATARLPAGVIPAPDSAPAGASLGPPEAGMPGREAPAVSRRGGGVERVRTAAVAWVHRLYRRLAARPEVVALGVFLLAALPLGLAFVGWGSGSRSPEPGPEGVATAIEADAQRLQYLSLLAESQALYETGDAAAAARLLAQAEELAPEARRIRELRQEARRQVATERALDRFERVEAASERGHLQVARGDLDGAGRTLRDLVALGAPVEAVSSLRRSLARARDRLREAAESAAAEAKPVEAPVPAVVLEPVQPPVEPVVVPTGPATLTVAFRSQRPRGVVTVYVGDEQVLRRSFRFFEKKGLLRRKAAAGSFREEIQVESGPVDLKVYLALPGRSTALKSMAVELKPAARRTLDVAVDAEGRLEIR